MALGDQQSPGPMGPCQAGTHVNFWLLETPRGGLGLWAPSLGRESSACVP